MAIQSKKYIFFPTKIKINLAFMNAHFNQQVLTRVRSFKTVTFMIVSKLSYPCFVSSSPQYQIFTACLDYKEKEITSSAEECMHVHVCKYLHLVSFQGRKHLTQNKTKLHRGRIRGLPTKASIPPLTQHRFNIKDPHAKNRFHKLKNLHCIKVGVAPHHQHGLHQFVFGN